MARYRDALPQLSDRVFVTDSGLETDLIFNGGFDLPEFASFVLLDDEKGVAALRRYFLDHFEVAADNGVGIVVETPTWRANRDWGAKVGYDSDALADVNRRAIGFVTKLRESAGTRGSDVVVSGCIGPRGDGYRPDSLMSADEAQRYHAEQINTFADTDADLVSALTLTYADEAIGIVKAAQAAGIPVVIGFTVETDGRLPDGTTLAETIQSVDAATNNGAAYFMVNCAHPSHIEPGLAGGDWVRRVRSLRVNASRMSHAELDESTELDDGNPKELGSDVAALARRYPSLSVLGGCCGTDARHVREIAQAIRG